MLTETTYDYVERAHNLEKMAKQEEELAETYRRFDQQANADEMYRRATLHYSQAAQLIESAAAMREQALTKLHSDS